MLIFELIQPSLPPPIIINLISNRVVIEETNCILSITYWLSNICFSINSIMPALPAGFIITFILLDILYYYSSLSISSFSFSYSYYSINSRRPNYTYFYYYSLSFYCLFILFIIDFIFFFIFLYIAEIEPLITLFVTIAILALFGLIYLFD